MKKIFIVEDDIGISQSLKLYLENSDFSVMVHETWEWATEAITKEDPHLVILDINLPKKSGLEICSELRAISSVPVIMLTAQTGETDKISGLEVGADDYIAKPFSPRELLARIQSVMRRYDTIEQSEDTNTLSYKNIKIQLDKNTVSVDGNEANLTKNEFDILKKVFEQDGKLVLRETLMKEVIWYDQYVYDRTIDTHIKNLRKKIGDKEAILTIRGKWYRLNK